MKLLLTIATGQMWRVHKPEVALGPGVWALKSRVKKGSGAEYKAHLFYI